MCKVSIIIPAYNIESYIERCILSCINQTFREIEIIVVNDGSTDKTLDKINKLKSDDNRIVVIDKKNEGSMEARKSGWDIAKGEYILFVDGDDHIHKDTVEILYGKAKKQNYDIVCYKFFIENHEGVVNKGWEKEVNISENIPLLDLLFSGKISHCMWSKLIRKDFVSDNRIEFPSNFSYGEDLAFIYTLAMYNPLFTVIDDCLYYYCRREGSLDNDVNEKTTEIIQALIFVKSQLIKNNIYEKYREEFEYIAYIQGYYMRKAYIFNHKDKISRRLFNNWKQLKININTKNNNFYRRLYKNDSKKALIVEEICKNSYMLGQLYYKVMNLKITFIKSVLRNIT